MKYQFAFDLKINRIGSQIVHLHFPTIYTLTSTMVRLQEFYESAIPTIRDQVFELEDFMDAYAETRSWKMDYFTLWTGFNIPDSAIREFYTRFVKLRPKEIGLHNILFPWLVEEKPFYLIATNEEKDKAFEHEIAHAMFYLDPEYRLAQTDIVMSHGVVDKTNALFGHLEDMGYGYNVHIDEVQAYLSTSDIDYLNETFAPVMFETDDWMVSKLKSNFEHYRKKWAIETPE